MWNRIPKETVKRLEVVVLEGKETNDLSIMSQHYLTFKKYQA